MATVRPLAAGDEAAWRVLWRDYLAFYETTRPESVYAAAFRRLLDPAEPMGGFIAEADGAPVGLAHYVIHRTLWAEEDTCYLQDLYVAPAARGTGAGRALIEAVYAAATRAGAVTVYWLTAETNYAGRTLYDRVGRRTGFIEYERP